MIRKKSEFLLDILQREAKGIKGDFYDTLERGTFDQKVVELSTYLMEERGFEPKEAVTMAIRLLKKNEKEG